MQPLQKFKYTVKIYDPQGRSKFTLRDLHSMNHQFESVKALRSVIYHELDEEIPDGDYNVHYFEGSQHKKKWLVSFTDLAAMYAHLKVKNNIPLWCDGKESAPDSQDDDERPQKKKQKKSKDRDTHTKTVNEQEEELERVFQKLRDKRGSTSCGQELLYPECTIMMIDPLMHLCLVQKQPTESIVDAFTGAATVVAKAIVNPKAL